VLSWAVARAVAAWISAGSAKDCPTRAALRNRRHQLSCRFSHAAPTGMKAWVILYRTMLKDLSAGAPALS
jgi:hypothetical protein